MSCSECTHIKVCLLYRKIERFIKGIESSVNPTGELTMKQIISIQMGNRCFHFKKKVYDNKRNNN